MRKINIVVGTYGYRKNDTAPVDLINSASGPIEVTDEEADRLIGLGIAKGADEVVEEPAEETGHLDAESLEEYDLAELKDLAGKMGIKFKGRISKADLIKLISDEEVKYPVEDDMEDADNEEPPVLDAADPE